MSPFTDKMIHTIQFFGLLVTAMVLILFAHAFIPAELVFTSMIAGLSGIVGSRIASNGYAVVPSRATTESPLAGTAHVDNAPDH